MPAKLTSARAACSVPGEHHSERTSNHVVCVDQLIQAIAAIGAAGQGHVLGLVG